MQIRRLLRTKGTDVLTVAPDAPVTELLALLAERGVGAAVVSPDGRHVAGIVSERDVVRALALRGGAVLEEPVSAIATAMVRSTGPEEQVAGLMRVMTEARVRHVPVLEDEVLAGIVSIGDVVKSQLEALESERDALQEYVSSPR